MSVPRETLISAAYLAEMEALHAAPRGFGAKGFKWEDMVASLFISYRCASILDYGAGQGSLQAALNARGVAWKVQSYDPAVEKFSADPAPADLVVCADVLEHVEGEKLGAVIDHLANLTRTALFVVVGLTPTAKTLSDGRQAHISLHPPTWWRAALGRRFRQTEEHAIRPEKQWVAVFLPRKDT